MSEITEVTCHPSDGRVVVTYQADDPAEYERLVDKFTRGGGPRNEESAPGSSDKATPPTSLSAPSPQPKPEAPEAAPVRVCLVCGQPLTGKRNKKYCGAACRKRAQREREGKSTPVPPEPAPPEPSVPQEEPAEAGLDDGDDLLPNGTRAIIQAARHASRGGTPELYELIRLVQVSASISPSQLRALRDQWGDTEFVARLKSHGGVIEAVRLAKALPVSPEDEQPLEVEFDGDPQYTQPPNFSGGEERRVRSVGAAKHGRYGFRGN